MTDIDPTEALIMLTSDIVAAHVSNNAVAVEDVAALISNVFGALSGLGETVEEEEVLSEPAVAIRSSIKPDYIVCLEDGQKLKMLKRHLMTHYNMTPDQYRKRWSLPADYPMVAPSYSEKRRELANKIGLGRKPAAPAPPDQNAASKEAAAPKKTAAPRKTTAAAKTAASQKTTTAKKKAAPRKKAAAKKAPAAPAEQGE